MFACWHPVDGPLALALIGEAGPDAASTGLVAPDAVSVAEATAGATSRPVADASLADTGVSPAAEKPQADPDSMGSAESAGQPVVLAAGLEVTPDGRLEVTEREVAVAAAAGDGALSLLELRNLVKEFPITSGAILQRKVSSVKAVSDVSFSVAGCTTFGLVGESGCGKTTIGKMIVALEKPNSVSTIL